MMWNFKAFGNRTAIIDEKSKEEISYSALSEAGEKLIGAIGKRCLVFAMCQNAAGSVVGYTAFVNGNVVPVLLNAHMDRALLYNLVENYKPSYLWTPSDRVDEFLNEFPDYQEVFSSYDYSLIKTGFEIEYEIHPDLCLMLTTSGSTGSPKFVRQSYDNVRENAASIVKYLELDENERPITTLPMNYTYGLSIINSHLMVGATILMTEKTLMQKEFWNFFKDQKATSFGGVPYTYEILAKLRFFRMDLPSLKYMTQAGGKITPELHKQFAEYAQGVGKKFIVMYGQCEATARMGYLPADRAVEKCGSMGIAIPGGRFYLYDTDDNEITEPDVTGELVYEGPNVTMGYAQCKEDLIKGDERGGILKTGDMAKRDDEGFYYIVGRKKRFLKIYGNRVNLDEIDRMIKGHFDNIECASGGIDDHMTIFLTKAGEELSAEVREFVAAKTKLNPAAFKVMVIDGIPKNDSGKVLYRELEKYYS